MVRKIVSHRATASIPKKSPIKPPTTQTVRLHLRFLSLMRSIMLMTPETAKISNKKLSG
jgi:hypothetical protein